MAVVRVARALRGCEARTVGGRGVLALYTMRAGVHAFFGRLMKRDLLIALLALIAGWGGAARARKRAGARSGWCVGGSCATGRLVSCRERSRRASDHGDHAGFRRAIGLPFLAGRRSSSRSFRATLVRPECSGPVYRLRGFHWPTSRCSICSGGSGGTGSGSSGAPAGRSPCSAIVK